MNNILKQFAGSAISLQRDKFRLATFKLTFFYVLSTAVILLMSSVAVLIIFAPAETDMPFRAEVEAIEIEHEEWSLYEVREHLGGVIFLVDLILLLIVGTFAHFFARRTLLPIKDMHEAQQRFMNDAAHELRTPLSVIQIGADTILRKHRSLAEYEDFVTDVQSEARRLTRLSNQLLQLLRTEEYSQAVRTEEDISSIVKGEIKRFRPYADERKITITDKVSPDLIVNTDKDSLTQVIQNLLKNAADYNQPNGHITVYLDAEKDFVSLSIEDTGLGIPTDKQAAVFDRFTKVDSARTHSNESGMGLGLAIVKSLVTKLGGRIVLNSTVGVGTKITITLPVKHS